MSCGAVENRVAHTRSRLPASAVPSAGLPNTTGFASVGMSEIPRGCDMRGLALPNLQK